MAPLIIALISIGVPILLDKLAGDAAPAAVGPPTSDQSVPTSYPAISTTTAAPEDPRWQRVYSHRSIDIEESPDCPYSTFTVVDWDKDEPTVYPGSHQAPGISFTRGCDTDDVPIIGGPIGFGSVLEPTPQLCFEQADGEDRVTGIEDREYRYILKKGDTYCGVTTKHNVLWLKVIEVDRAGGPMARIEATLWTRRA
ncbi:hypothetical protein AB0M34_09965 [Nocardia sp. NPDC050193]